MKQRLGPATQLVEAGNGLRASLPAAAGPQDGAPDEAPDAASIPVFVVRHAGRLHAWINRCPHRGTELDWEPGVFFDESGEFLMCATHGALFDPNSGRCVAGPCSGASLTRVAVDEMDGEILLGGDRSAASAR